MSVVINRAPFNALVDDDGTNTQGTPWNKQAIKDVLLDPVDVALAALPGTIPAGGGTSYGGILTDTGTLNDYVLPYVNGASTYFFWVGAGDLTLTGLAATGTKEGTTITISNHGANLLRLMPESLSSASQAGNRFDNFVGSAPVLLCGLGVVTYTYIAARWRILYHEQGAWYQVPFNAANFLGAASMIWTVEAADCLVNRLRISGRTLQWEVKINNSTTAGTPSNQLVCVIPVGSLFSNAFGAAWVYDAPAGGPQGAYVESYVNNPTTQVGIVKTTQLNYNLAANGTYATFSLFGELA